MTMLTRYFSPSAAGGKSCSPSQIYCTSPKVALLWGMVGCSGDGDGVGRHSEENRRYSRFPCTSLMYW